MCHLRLTQFTLSGQNSSLTTANVQSLSTRSTTHMRTVPLDNGRWPPTTLPVSLKTSQDYSRTGTTHLLCRPTQAQAEAAVSASMSTSPPGKQVSVTVGVSVSVSVTVSPFICSLWLWKLILNAWKVSSHKFLLKKEESFFLYQMVLSSVVICTNKLTAMLNIWKWNIVRRHIILPQDVTLRTGQ